MVNTLAGVVMTTLPKPFEHPIQIGDLDCLAMIRVDGYAPGCGDGWNEPKYGPEVQFTFVGLRVDGDEPESAERVWGNLNAILQGSEELRQACLDAIEEANQPPED